MSKAGSGEPPREHIDRLQREVAELRTSRRRLLEAADADRRAIERDLHDGLQQSLVALAIDMRRLAGLLDRDVAAARTLVAELVANVGELLDEATELAQAIYPPLLEARGLASALRSAAESAGVTIVVDIPPGGGYPPEVTAILYLSCVEVLSSAPPGSQATVSVLDAAGTLTFDIAIAGTLAEGRFVRLRDRIEAFDGRVSAAGQNDGGSRVQGSLPVARSP